MELSSEVPGTDANWPSDISLQVNGIEIERGPPRAISATSAVSIRPNGGS